jgi:hypothetical protein
MFERLRQLAARLMRRDGPRFDPPLDPYAGVRQPRKFGPGGRHSAVAVVEPEPDRAVDAIARSRRRRRRRVLHGEH